MILQTDFLDHWKTQMLIEELGDPASPLYLIRLWAHCQTRKQYRFAPEKLTPKILKGITRSTVDPQTLWNALLEVGFIDLHEDGTIEAHGFHDANSQLIANWKNGKKGGRPKKNKATPEKPIQNPTVTHPEPIERVERKEGREEKEEIEKQDEIKDEAGSSLSPSSRKKPFWFGTPYGGRKPDPVEDYDELFAFDDPILAAMAVTQERSKALYGFLVKGCNSCLEAGIDPDEIKKFLFIELEKLLGEIKSGERQRGMNAASTFETQFEKGAQQAW